MPQAQQLLGVKSKTKYDSSGTTIIPDATVGPRRMHHLDRSCAEQGLGSDIHKEAKRVRKGHKSFRDPEHVHDRPK